MFLKFGSFFVVLFSTVVYFFLRYTKPTYESFMVIQLDNQDNAKDIIELENINSKQDDISSEIELMRSQFMFERAIKRTNYNVSLFSKGQVLTEEKYLSSSFYVTPFELKDSSLINIPINVSFDGKQIKVNYTYLGRNFALKGSLNERLSNQHFDIAIDSPNPGEFKNESDDNELYFVFNSVESYAARLLPSLQIVPVDPVAKTIQITFQGNNPQLCHDISLAVAEAFIE